MLSFPTSALLIVLGGTAAIIALVFGVVYGSSAKRAKRYRPAQPFEFTPVWFLAQPQQLVAGQEASTTHLAIAEQRVVAAGTKGGASGKW